MYPKLSGWCLTATSNWVSYRVSYGVISSAGRASHLHPTIPTAQHYQFNQYYFPSHFAAATVIEVQFAVTIVVEVHERDTKSGMTRQREPDRYTRRIEWETNNAQNGKLRHLLQEVVELSRPFALGCNIQERPSQWQLHRKPAIAWELVCERSRMIHSLATGEQSTY